MSRCALADIRVTFASRNRGSYIGEKADNLNLHKRANTRPRVFIHVFVFARPCWNFDKTNLWNARSLSSKWLKPNPSPLRRHLHIIASLTVERAPRSTKMSMMGAWVHNLAPELATRDPFATKSFAKLNSHNYFELFWYFRLRASKLSKFRRSFLSRNRANLGVPTHYFWGIFASFQQQRKFRGLQVFETKFALFFDAQWVQERKLRRNT